MEERYAGEDAPSAFEMSEDEADDWQDETDQVGQALLPALQQLVVALPSARSIMVSTADGFNLCSLGLTEEVVDHISAMGSALHSVARSAVESLGDHAAGEPAPLDALTIAHGSHTTVVLTVPVVEHEYALLWITGTTDTLGSILFRARAAVPAIVEVLHDFFA